MFCGEVGVDVRFTYDLNGILEVDMSIVGTERSETLVIESASQDPLEFHDIPRVE